MVKYYPLSLNATFAALADPTRRRILESLSRQQKRVTDLAEPFAMSLPAVSKHLRVLEDAGLLAAADWVANIIWSSTPRPCGKPKPGSNSNEIQRSLDALAGYLEKNNPPQKTKKKKNHEHNHHPTRLPKISRLLSAARAYPPPGSLRRYHEMVRALRPASPCRQRSTLASAGNIVSVSKRKRWEKWI